MKETIKKERGWETLKRVGLCVHGSALQEESRHDLELSRNSWHLVLRSQMNPKQIHIAGKIQDRDAPRKQPKGKERLKTIFLLKKLIQQQISQLQQWKSVGWVPLGVVFCHSRMSVDGERQSAGKTIYKQKNEVANLQLLSTSKWMKFIH